MLNLGTALPTDIGQWLTIIALDIAGVFAFAALFDKTRRERSKLLSEETAELIGILKQKVEALEGSVKESNQKVRDNEILIAKVQAENKTLREVLQGRDGQTVEFQRLAMKAMETVSENYKITVKNGEQIASLAQSVEKLARVIELEHKTA